MLPRCPQTGNSGDYVILITCIAYWRRMTAIFLPMGDCAEYIARLTKCLTTALWLVNIKSTNLQNRFTNIYVRIGTVTVKMNHCCDTLILKTKTKVVP